MPKPAITTFSSLAVNQSPTNKDNGLYAPELTQEQIDAIPADTLRNGAIVYNTTEDSFEIYEDGDWEDINTTGGDVEGPDGADNNNVPVFDGTSGKIIRDSGVPIAPVPVLLLSQRTNKKFLKAPLVTVNEIGNLGHIRFVNDVGIIFVDGLMPVEFITNDFGPESQVCSLFTGGLPSASSSPSALVELQTTTGTLLLSRLTQAEINALTLPIPGMVVYNTTTGKLSVYTSTGWMPVLVADASGNLDMQGYKIINLATPTLSTDGANKGYVDAAISGIPSAIITLTGGVTGSGVVTSPITTTVVSVAPSAITGYPGTTSTFLRGDGTWTNILSGNLGLQGATPNAPLQFTNGIQNRKIVLNEVANNDHQFFGFGTSGSALRYQVNAQNSNHIFLAGTSSTTSNEIMRINGFGFVGISTSAPNAPLQFSNTLESRKIVLNEVLNNDHQVTALGTNSNIFRFQIPATTNDYVFYAGTSSTTSNEVARITGTGNAIIPNNLGIGITPTVPLHVKIPLGVSDIGTEYARFQGSGVRLNIFDQDLTGSPALGARILFNSGAIGVIQSASSLAIIPGSGSNVGINTYTPSTTFQVVGTSTLGNITVSGNTISASSGGNIQIGQPVFMSDNGLWLRTPSDTNHGMVYNATINGPQFRAFGSFTWNNGTSGATELMRLSSAGYLGIGTATPNAFLQISNANANRKIVLFDDQNNDFQFIGFGVSSNTLRYNVSGPNTNHVFFSGVDATSANELMRIRGNGNVGIGNSAPNAPLQFSNVLANRKIVLNEVLNNDHQITALGTNSNIFRFQVAATTNDYVFYAGTSSTTSNELARVKGTGGLDVVNNKIINLATPTLGTDAANKSYVDSTTGNVANAKYIIQTSNASLPNAQVLGSLTTGLLKNTTTTGVLSIGVAGTDYYSPGFPTFFKDTNGTTNNFFAGTSTGNNTTGAMNVAVGIETMFTNTTGGANVAFGFRALYSNSSGTGNVALGWRALELNTIGLENVAIGAGPLSRITSGSYNVGIGTGVLSDNISGNNNIGIGAGALNAVTTGTKNIAIGLNTGLTCTTSTKCIFIGEFADASVNNLTNAIAIGADAIVGASNSIVLGNGCNVGIGTSTPNAPLQFANTLVNRKIALYQDANNDHQFNGLGINAGIIRYQGSSTTVSHVFYAGTSSTTSNELARITGTGNVGIGTSTPNTPLQFSNTLANRKIVLLESANNDHQVIGLGTAANTFRFQAPTTTNDYVFYAGTSSTTSNELARITGTGKIIAQNAISTTGDIIAAGNIYGNRPRGLIYFNSTTPTTFNVAANTPFKIPVVTVGIGLNQFSASSNRLSYVGTEPITVLVTANVSCANTNAASAFTTISIYKGSTLVTGSSVTQLSAATTYSENISTQTIVSMVAGDYVEVFAATTVTQIINFYSLLLSVTTT